MPANREILEAERQTMVSMARRCQERVMEIDAQLASMPVTVTEPPPPEPEPEPPPHTTATHHARAHEKPKARSRR
jgi:hypothetical protein